MFGSQRNHITYGASFVSLAPLASCLDGYTRIAIGSQGRWLSSLVHSGFNSGSGHYSLYCEVAMGIQMSCRQWTTCMDPAEITFFVDYIGAVNMKSYSVEFFFSWWKWTMRSELVQDSKHNLSSNMSNSHFCHSLTNDSTMWDTESLPPSGTLASVKCYIIVALMLIFPSQTSDESARNKES